MKRRGAWAGPVLALVLPGCDLEYPQVVVVNRTSAAIQVRNPSFSGCVWNTVLGYGETTGVARCLPGSDRVHFQKLDVAAYCRQHTDDPSVVAACAGDAGSSAPGPDAGPGAVPTWFNYQTLSTHRAGYGEFHVLEIQLEDIEQDFSVPGPYGH